MDDTTVEVHDFLSIFKSKIEDAVSIVGLIPEEQREEVWKFWDLITDTVKIYTSFYLRSVEEENIATVISIPDGSTNITVHTPASNRGKKGKKLPRKPYQRKRLGGSTSGIILKSRVLKRKATKRVKSKKAETVKNKVSEEVTASVVALNESMLNESNVVYYDRTSTSDISDLIQFPNVADGESLLDQCPAVTSVETMPVVQLDFAPPSVVSQCEVSIPSSTKRKPRNNLKSKPKKHPQGNKKKTKTLKKDTSINKTASLESQTQENEQAVKHITQENEDNLEEGGESRDNHDDLPNSQEEDEGQIIESGNQKSEANAKDVDKENKKKDSNKVRRSGRKRRAKLKYAADGTIDYTEGIPLEIFHDDEKCDIGMDHAYDEDFKTLMGGRKRPKIKKIKEPKGPPDFTCKECGVTLSNTGALTVHMRKHTGSRPFFCDTCGKTFTTKANMQRHVKSHEGIKPFKCETCGKAFTEKKTLQTHERLHTGEKPFKCTECGKSFTQRATLNNHMNIHTGNTPHLCELCGKEFNQRPNLVTHMKRHINNKQFKCDHCNYFFITKGELERHSVKHTGEKPFLCTLCPKKFTRMQYLSEHMNQHTGTKPYSCTKCSCKFHDLSAYCRHTKKHKDNEENKKTEEGEEVNKDLDPKVKKEVNVQSSCDNGKEREVVSTSTDSAQDNSGEHVIVATNGGVVQQIHEAISQQVVKIREETEEGEHEFQTVILRGTAEQQAEAIEALQQQLMNQATGDVVSNILVEHDEDAASLVESNGQEVYQIWVDPASNEVMATVDFSAFNLLANATAKQYPVTDT